MGALPEDIRRGQAVYTPLTLRAYDAFVLGLSNTLVWRCPTAELLALYDRNVADRHVDIGVGTGYFLDHARWPTPHPAITLVDLNAASLAAAAARVARYSHETIEANALAPLPRMGPFRSAGLCYLLHCLPGRMEDKLVVLDHLAPSLEPGACVFGATILGRGVAANAAARRLMAFYNARGIFSNADDSQEALEAGLAARLDAVRITLRGVVAMFEGRARG